MRNSGERTRLARYFRPPAENLGHGRLGLRNKSTPNLQSFGSRSARGRNGHASGMRSPIRSLPRRPVTPCARQSDVTLHGFNVLTTANQRESAGRIFTSSALLVAEPFGGNRSVNFSFLGCYGLQAGVQPSQPPMMRLPLVTLKF
jgi:hypothetical protein